MTTDQRKINELTDRLNQVTADRDRLRLQLNQMRAGFARIEREVDLALSQVEQLETEIYSRNNKTEAK